MEYIIKYFNDSEKLINDNLINAQLNDVTTMLNLITEEDIIFTYETQQRKGKSISEALLKLFHENLLDMGWESELPIFRPENNKSPDKYWSFNFYKSNVTLDINFQHSGSIVKNLVKSVLSSNKHDKEKNIHSNLSIIITATSEMKKTGGFDNAIADFDRYDESITILEKIVTSPLILIGLKAPKTFKIEHEKINNKNIGVIKEIDY